MPGHLYVYRDLQGAQNEYKVGMTEDCPKKRMSRSARTNSAVYVLVESWRVCWPKYAEKVVHACLHEFSARRKLKAGGGEWADGGREWFEVNYDVLEETITQVLMMVKERSKTAK